MRALVFASDISIGHSISASAEMLQSLFAVRTVRVKRIGLSEA
jgi:hypothetical protein